MENKLDVIQVRLKGATSTNSADSTNNDCSIHESDQWEEIEPDHVK